MLSQSEAAEIFRREGGDPYVMSPGSVRPPERYGDLVLKPCDNPGCVGPFCNTHRVPDRPARLYFTIGVQRSGKSTLARKWLHRETALAGEADDGYPRFMWDTDGLRLEMHGRAYSHQCEPMVFAVKRYSVATALRLGHDVVVAGTHTSHASIRRILEIRRDAVPVVVDTPLEVCLQRARDTGQDYLLPVIPRVHAQIQHLLRDGVGAVVEQVLHDIDNKVPY